MFKLNRLKLVLIAILLPIGGLKAVTLFDMSGTPYFIMGTTDYDAPNLSGAVLNGAVLSGADLWYADLSGADLSGADLRLADFSGANLNSANLSGANLSSATLSGADLRLADFSGANLNSANLSFTDLGVAFLNNTLYDSSTIFSDGFDPTAYSGLVLVPEPSSTALLGLGGLALMLLRRR